VVSQAWTLQVLQGDGASGRPRAGARARTDEASRQGHKALRCRACSRQISDESQIFTPPDTALLFVNRFGFVHEILTVRAAQNLLPWGAATTVDTWFAGYTWQIVLCVSCREHLGWHYRAESSAESSAESPAKSPAESAAKAPGGSDLPASFYGLRRAALVIADS
jgi:hypothetical protein